MTENKEKSFQIRNQQHSIVGTYTQQQIIDRISAGKYQGTEEVSVEPYLNWQKLSSHPAFYDAFLRRLFSEKYNPPKTHVSQVKSSVESKEEPKEQPRQNTLEHLGNLDSEAKNRRSQSEAQETQQLLTFKNQGVPGSEDSKEIAKLFLAEPDSSDDKDEIEKEAESLFQADEKGKALSLEDDLPIESDSENEPVTPNITDERRVKGSHGLPAAPERSKRRKRMIAAGVGLGLGLLYLMGQSPSSTEVLVTKNDGEVTLPAISAANLTNKLRKEEVISALAEEANHFYDLDTALHYSGSLSIFREAYQINPSDTQLLSGLILAQAHLLERDPNDQKAQDTIKKLIKKGRETEPQLSAFYRAEALMAFYLKNRDEAVEKIKYARESDPNEIEAAILEAEFLNAIGDRTTALEKIEGIVSGSPDKVRAYFVAAGISLDLGLWNKAEAYAKQALLINPIHANTHYILAETYQRKGNRAAAIAHFDLVTKLAPLASTNTLADAHFALGKLLEEQGNTTESLKHNKLAFYYSKGLLPGLNAKLSNQSVSDEKSLRELAEDHQYGVGFYNARAEDFLTEGRPVLGLEYLQVVRLLEPDKPEPLIRVAEVLETLAISYEKLKRVEILYQRAIQKDPTFIDSYLKLAGIETDQYNFGPGYSLLSQAATKVGLEDLDSFVFGGCRGSLLARRKAKDEYKVHLALGKHFFKRENFVCAAAFLKEARNESPANSEIFYYLGRLTELYKLDASIEAASYYYSAFTTNSTNYDALAAWGRLKTKLGEKNYVIKYVRALLSVEPENANLFWVLGEAYMENQEYLRAVTFFKKAIDNNNRLSKARISLARALSAVGQTYQAINEFTYAATTDRRNGIGLYEAAQLYMINKKYQEAELSVKALLESTPNYPGGHRLLSQIYQFNGKKDDAIAEMLIESKNNPQNTKFTLELAETYMKYQKYDAAIEALQRVTNLPGEKKAPEFRADRTQAFLLTSRCYRALSRPENAEGSIKLALDIDSNDPELHRELGYVYHAQQRYREGVKAFEIYLSRNPAGTDVENVKKLIKTMIIEE